jgi:hypothetical protein
MRAYNRSVARMKPPEVDTGTRKKVIAACSDDLFDFRLYIPVLKDPDGDSQGNYKIQQRIKHHDLARHGGGRKG